MNEAEPSARCRQPRVPCGRESGEAGFQAILAARGGEAKGGGPNAVYCLLALEVCLIEYRVPVPN